MPNTTMNGEVAARPRGPVRTITATLLLVLVMLAVVHLALPPLWGSPELALKWQALHRQPRPDRLLIGSSRIFRQVIPSLMDSLMGQGRTFNAAYAATFPPATYVLCEHLLDEEKPPARVILMELSTYMLFEEANLEDHRYWYYLDPREGLDLIRHALRLPGQTCGVRLGYASRAFRATANSILGMGLADHLLASAPDADTVLALGFRGDGCITLEEQALRTPKDTKLLARHADLLADTLEAQRRANAIRSRYARAAGTDVSRVHLARLNALLSKARQKGVVLIFVLPPLWVDRGEDLVALARALPAPAVIALCNPDTFPQFYRVENMYDVGHLNDRGSRAFTIALARALGAMPNREDLSR